MFDGVPADQLHQFIAAASSSSATSIPFPLSFSNSSSSSSAILSLHHHHHHHHQTNSNIFPTFDPFSIITSSSSSSQQQVQQQQPHHHFLHSLQQLQRKNNEEEKEENRNSSTLVGGMEMQKDPVWSQDELLALLRIRSSLENWFPELTWEHVSRRLEEFGYKRSAEKCKEKFEEESRNFNNINYNKNYKTIFCEFDDEQELYHGQNNLVAEQNKKMDQQPREEEEEEEEEDKMMGQNDEEDPRNNQTVANKSSSDHQDKEKTLLVEKLSEGSNNNKKRKLMRKKNFETFKVFCEDIVKKMMAQQEEVHNKLLEDMVKRDEEDVAREEAWKKQENDRILKELELRASEQAIAGDRQATIIKFLTNFSSSSSEASGDKHNKVPNISTINNPPTSSSLILAQNPNPIIQNLEPQNPSSNNLAPTIIPKMPTSSSAIALAYPQSPSFPIAPTSTPTQHTSQKLLITTSNSSNNKDDIGKRWPRDEVLALINLRCNYLYNSNGDHQDNNKEGGASAIRNNIPLWERISQGMLELGYKRSAKRCKEKWENINKYFRKTKDANKKRSLDSRTCPYFHQLNTLYNQGRLVVAPPPSDGTENSPAALPENHSTPSENHDGSGTDDLTMHNVAQGEKSLVQVVQPAFGFEF